MTPKEQAKELFEKMPISKYDISNDNFDNAKQCALIAVNYIIASNPHSNPFNTEVYSTIKYWLKVKEEIELL